MNIFVCVKQVPDTETKIKLNSDASGIDESGVKWVMNPYDEFAVEEALKLKSAQADSKVTVISLGPKKRVIETLRTALAMGADEGILIEANEFVDSFTTAKALAAAINAEPSCDLIFTGMSGIDVNAGACSQQLAENLGFAHAVVVDKFEYTDGKVLVERATEGGTKEVIEITGPCVIGATKGLNTPRYASLPGIMKAKKKPLKETSLPDLGIAGTTKINFKDFQLPQEKSAVKIIDGDVSVQTKELVRLLREEAKVL